MKYNTQQDQHEIYNLSSKNHCTHIVGGPQSCSRIVVKEGRCQVRKARALFTFSSCNSKARVPKHSFDTLAAYLHRLHLHSLPCIAPQYYHPDTPLSHRSVSECTLTRSLSSSFPRSPRQDGHSRRSTSTRASHKVLLLLLSRGILNMYQMPILPHFF